MSNIRCPSCDARVRIRVLGRCPICATPIVQPLGAVAIAVSACALLLAGIVGALRPRSPGAPLASAMQVEPTLDTPADAPAAAEAPRPPSTPEPLGGAAPTDAAVSASAGATAEADARAEAATALCRTLDADPAWEAVCTCLGERARGLPPLSPTEDGIGMSSPPRLRERPYVRALAECAYPFHQRRAVTQCRTRCRTLSAPCNRVCACVASPSLTETGFTPEGDKHLLARGEPQALYRRMMLCEDEHRRGMRYEDGEYLVVPGLGEGRIDRIRVVSPTFTPPTRGGPGAR